jgi:hypothetical protein
MGQCVSHGDKHERQQYPPPHEHPLREGLRPFGTTPNTSSLQSANEAARSDRCGYLYMLREREHVNAAQPVYKVGRTTQPPEKRFMAYPKGSEVLVVVRVPDCIAAEALLLQQLRQRFTSRVDIGAEYFQGEPQRIRHMFSQFI